MINLAGKFRIMKNPHPAVDAYIEKALPFARPILTKIRKTIHKACPGITETVKWGMPFFDYQGPIAGMAAFKAHCAFFFWKAALLEDPENYLQKRAAEGGSAMGNFGKIGSVNDLPPEKVIIGFVKQAMRINEAGIKVTRKKAAPVKEPEVPVDLSALLKKHKVARQTFEAFPPSHRKEYIQWITEAKTEATRMKRTLATFELLKEGKSLNWKYQSKK